MSTARTTVVQIVLEVGRGGLETMCADLAIELRQRGLTSVVVGLDAGGQLEERLRSHEVEFVNLGGRRMFDPRYHARLAHVLAHHRPAAVHSHGFAPLLHACVSRLVAGRPRLVHTEHSIEYLLTRHDYRRALGLMSRATSAFVVLGERMRRYYAEEIGVAPSRLRVIPNGVAPLPVATPERRAAARRSLGFGEGFLVATVGRLAPEKNYAMLLSAFAASCGTDPTARIVFAGEGTERERLAAQASELGLGDRVVFLGWRTDVSELLHAFDVFAMSSISEGLPMAMLEAMSAGLAVVSTRVGDIPDVVTDGVTGRLTPPEDRDALAGAIAELRGSAVERVRLGEAARTLVIERYSRAAMTDAYLEAYGLGALRASRAA